MLALGLCATYYTLKRHGEEKICGRREDMLKRDGDQWRSRGAPASESVRSRFIVTFPPYLLTAARG